jgi:hypothetical protein
MLHHFAILDAEDVDCHHGDRFAGGRGCPERTLVGAMDGYPPFFECSFRASSPYFMGVPENRGSESEALSLRDELTPDVL